MSLDPLPPKRLRMRYGVNQADQSAELEAEIAKHGPKRPQHG